MMRAVNTWMQRLAQFLRSVLPADPFQVCFLAGLVCLAIAPRLLWWPTAPNDHWSTVLDQLPEPPSFYAVRIVAGFGMLVASSAGYFFCLWPGKRPALKIGLLVLLPAVLLTAVTGVELSIVDGGYSVLYRVHTSSLAFSRVVVTQLWLAGPGERFAILGIVLTGIFWTRLWNGRSRLPVTLQGDGRTPDVPPALQGAKRLIWFAVAPLGALWSALLGRPLFLLLARAGESWGDRAWVLVSWLQELIAASIVVGTVLLLAGRDNRKALWSLCTLPKPVAIVVATALPLAATLLPAIAHFFVDRASWAANDFGKYSPPELLHYLPVPVVWMVGLIFAAFGEEVIFRGVLQKLFVERYGIWRGVFLVGVIWAAIHFSSDRYRGSSDTDIALRVLHRIATCVILGFALSWLTLRFESILPATAAHWLSNVGILSSRDGNYPGSEWIRTLVWLLVVLVLYRFWPIPEPAPEESPGLAADSEPASA